MLQRFLNMLKSLKTDKRVEEQEISTTVDDTKEGSRVTFSKERVREVLEKSGLLEKNDQ